MKRDMDLIRRILLEVERQPYDLEWIDLEIDGHTPSEVSYHVMLLAEAGLIEAEDLSTMSGPNWKPKRLTWQGH